MEEKARSEKTRMLAGELYDPADAESLADRDRAALLIHQFNLSSPEGSLRQALLDELLCDLGKGSVIRPPFYCDYGYNIRIGPGCFLNHGCVLLDVMPIEIGAFCQLGPYVQLLTPDHPRDPHVRPSGGGACRSHQDWGKRLDRGRGAGPPRSDDREGRDRGGWRSGHARCFARFHGWRGSSPAAAVRDSGVRCSSK